MTRVIPAMGARVHAARRQGLRTLHSTQGMPLHPAARRLRRRPDETSELETRSRLFCARARKVFLGLSESVDKLVVKFRVTAVLPVCPLDTQPAAAADRLKCACSFKHLRWRAGVAAAILAAGVPRGAPVDYLSHASLVENRA
jgi:hypothetical protein